MLAIIVAFLGNATIEYLNTRVLWSLSVCASVCVVCVFVCFSMITQKEINLGT